MSQKKPSMLSTAKRKSRISTKLAKKSEIAAKKLDKDVAKLKVNEFRQVEVQSSASPDIVANKSWRLPSHAATQLVNAEESTEQKPNSQSATVDIDNRHVTAQSASTSTDSEKTLPELPQQAHADEAQTTNAPKFQDYGSSESTHLGQGPHFDDTPSPLITLSQLPEIGDVKQQIESPALTVSMARTTLTQIVRPPIISTEQHTPLTIDEQSAHQSVKEDAPVASASGKLYAHGGTVTPLQWTLADHQGQFGHLDIDPTTGEWHYQLDNNAINTNALAEGEHRTEQFSITVSSPNGEQVSTVIIIDVEGSNDLPKISGAHIASINAADSLPTVTGQLQSVDPDHNDVITWAVLDGQGQYGQLSINPLTGQWQYQLNNHTTATLALVSGQQVTETFTVTATDQSGHPVSQQVSIQVNGADNTAIIQGEITGLVTEDTQALNGQLTVSGQLSIQDPDRDQAHFSAGSLQGQFGFLTIDTNGLWIYSAENSQATIQSLTSGEHLTDTFIIHSADGTAQNITVTINGTDDKAEISGTTSASLTEDDNTHQGILRADGKLTITDNDHGPHQFTAMEQYGQFGTLIIDELGHWTYAADNSQAAIQALKTGESITETLVVQTQDGTQQKISITIHGTDDHSVIMGTSVMRVFEDKRLSQGQLHTDGQLWVSNPDTGRAGFAAEQLQGQFGILSINTHGHWSYTANNDNPNIQALKHGESLTETLFVQALDGTTQKIAILIKGADDKAIIGGVATATLIEDQSAQHGQLQAHGALTITDPDAGQGHFMAQTDVSGSAGLGHFSLDASGAWTYSADNTQAAFQQLKVGESLTDTLTVQSADGTTHTITVTLQGTNDAPVIVAQTQAVTEDGALLTGKMLATDMDAGDTQTFSIAQPVDGFTLNADGSYRFVPSNAAYQHLAAGQTQDVIIPITVTDSTGASSTQSLTITVTGTNDGASIAGVDSGTVKEDSRLTASGILTVVDIDSGEAHFIAQTDVSGSAGLGHFSLDASGAWTYSADNTQAAFQQLKVGESLTDTLTVTSADGTTHTITVTLQGTNDAPVIVAQTQAVTEDGALLTGKMLATDVDAGDTQTFSIAQPVDGFTLNADGSYSFDPSNAAYQHLAAGQTQDVIIPITVTDSTGASSTQSLTITVTGTNDGASIAGVDSGTVKEDSQLTASGILTVVDIDSGEAHFMAQTDVSGSTGLGHFSLDASGAWTYSADNTQAAFQQLKVGESLTDTLTVTSADGTTHTITVTLQGTNDAPVLAAQTQAVTEDGAQLTGKMLATDMDAGDTKAFSITQPVDGFTLNADGSYRFDPSNAAFQHLAAGQTQDVIIPITVTDSTGASSTQNLTIRLTGTNDAARISGTDIGQVIEDQTLSVSGQLQISDADDGQVHFIAQTATAGSYGSLTIGEDGLWLYQLDNNKPEVQALKSTETATDSFTVHSADGSSHSITVTIQGQRDNVVIGGVDVGVVKEDVSSVTGGHLVAIGESAEFVPFQQRTTLGNFSIDASGAWTYTLDNSRAGTQALKAGETATDTVTITHTDGTTHTVTVTVIGTNDGPTVAATSGHEVDLPTATEDKPIIFSKADLLALVHASDIDHDTLDISAVTIDPKYGQFAQRTDGSWIFTPTAQLSGDNLPVSITVTDGRATTEAHALLDITGVADTPTLQVTVDSLAHAAANSYTHADFSGAHESVDFDVTSHGYQVPGQHQAAGYYTVTTAHGGTADDVFRFSDLQSGQAYRIDGGQGANTLDLSNYHADDVRIDTGTKTITVTLADGSTSTITYSNVQQFRFADSVFDGTPHGVIPVVGQWVVEGSHIEATGNGAMQTALVHYEGNLAQDYTLAATVDAKTVPGLYTNAGIVFDYQDPHNYKVAVLRSGQHAWAIEEVVNGHTTQVAKVVDPAMTTPDVDHRIEIHVHGSVVELWANGALKTSHDFHQPLNDGQFGVVADHSHAAFTLAMQPSDWAPSAPDLNILMDAADGKIVTENVLSQAADPEGHAVTLSGFDTQSVNHGTVTRNPDGTFGYVPAPGFTGLDTFTYKVTDGVNETTATVRVTVANIHTVTGTHPGDAFSVNIGASSADSSESVTTRLTGLPDGSVVTDGTHSAVVHSGDHLDVSGWALHGLTVTPPATQTGNYLFHVETRSTDGADTSPWVSTPLRVQLNTAQHGFADATISGDSGKTTDEDSSVSGTLTVTDSDATQAHFDVQTDTAGTYGKFSISADGHWTYTPDDRADALAAGATQKESFTVTSADGTTQQVLVTLTGTDDHSVVSHSGDSGSVTEDSGVTATGKLEASGALTVSDIDSPAPAFVAQSGVRGSSGFGSFSVDTAGHWTYSADNSNPAVQALGPSTPGTDSLTVTTVDGTQHTVTVTLHGVNERTLAGDLSGSAREDSATVITGDLNALQSGTTLHLGDHVMHGTYGSLDLRDQGHWSYSLDNSNAAVQGLKEGETRTEVFTITGPGGQPQDITITVTGTHDQPVISVPTAAAQTIGGVTVTHDFDGADVHLLDTNFQTSHNGVPVGTHIVALYMPSSSVNLLANIAPGQLPTVHAAYDTQNGYTLTACGAGFQFLDQHQWFGQHLDGGAARYTPVAPNIRNNFDGGIVVFSDGTIGRLVKVCDDNSPSGAGDYLYFNKFDGVNAHQGISTLTGIGTAGSQVEVFDGTTSLGHATVDAQGHWSLAVPHALADGAHQLHTVSGGQTSAIMHAQVAAGVVTLTAETPSIGDVTEDGGAAHTSLSGHLGVSDTDIGDNPVFTTQTDAAGHYGKFSIDAQGNWHYTLDNSLATTNELASGQTRTETFTVEVATASGEHVAQTVQVTVTGSNDGPMVTATAGHEADLGTTAEDTPHTFTEAQLLQRVGATDVDGDTLSVSAVTVDSQYGAFSRQANGDWVFTPAANVHHDDIPLTVTVSDGHATTQAHGTLDITAANDAPTVGATLADQINEDVQSHNLDLLHGSADIDGNPLSVTGIQYQVDGQAVTGAPAGLTLSTDGQTLQLDTSGSTYQHLAAGQTQTIQVSYRIVDGQGGETPQTAILTITGTNDAPVVGVATSGTAAQSGPALQETHADHLFDKLIDSWLALPTTEVMHSIASNIQCALGSPQADAFDQMVWDMDPSATPGLSSKFVYSNADILLTGPGGTVDRVLAASGDTHSQTTLGDILNWVKQGPGHDIQFRSPVGVTPHLFLANQGTTDHISSTLSPVQIPGGADTALHNPYSHTTDLGSVAPFTHNAPVVVAEVTTGEVHEDTAISVTGTLHAQDTDDGDSLAFSLKGASHGQYGDFHVNAQTGAWTYTLHAGAQALDGGETQQERFTIVVTDSQGATVEQTMTLTVKGEEDQAVITGSTSGAVSEDGTLTASGQLSISDADSADHAAFVTHDASNPIQGAYGTLTLDAQGHWTYTLDNSKPEVQRLNVGTPISETIAVHGQDGSTQSIRIQISGTNDAPVVSGAVDLGSMGHTTAHTFAQAQLLATASDVDDLSSLSTGTGQGANLSNNLQIHNAQVDPAQGTVAVSADGRSLTFTPAQGFAGTAEIHYDVIDPHGGTAPAVAHVAVTNAAPVVVAADATHVADFGATAEDAAHTYTQTDLLQMVGATDADGDTLSVSAVTVDAQYGAFSKQANGDWLFTPAANAHHNDIPLTLTVSDGHATTTAQAVFDITPVTDAAKPALSVMAEQHVIQFGDTGAPAIFTSGGIQSGGNLDNLAVEMTVVGGSQVAVQGHNGPTLVSYATAGSINEFYIWRPENLQIHIAGHDYDTGVDISHDTGSHRYGFVWNSAAGSFDVLRDGQIVKHLDGVAQGTSVTGGGVLAFGNDQDSLGGGFQDSDAWHGKLFSATFAKGVTAADMTQHALRDLAHGADLIVDVQAQGQRVVDLTGHHTFVTSGPVTTPTTQVDTTIANPNPGALLHLSPQFGAPLDPDDRVTAALLKGFVAGTEVSDGHGHTFTVTGPNDSVDITHWDQSALTAQLPLGSHVGVQLVLEVTTTGPGGLTVTTASHTNSVSLSNDPDLTVTTDVTFQLDIAPTDSPALIAGQDTGNVTEDVGVTLGDSLEARGTLTIQDPDSGQAVFITQTDTPAQYGKFSIDDQGHWVYEASNSHPAIQGLASGTTLTDLLQVTSPDGTLHTISISIIGTNDAPMIAAQTQTVTEDGTQLTGQMVATDVDSGDTQTFSLANAVDGFTLSADGSYSFDPSNAAYQHLAAGQTQDVVIPITVTDSARATSTQNLTITVTGTDDGLQVAHATTATAADLGAINEDAPRVFTEAELLQAVGASDVDDGTSLHIVAGSLSSAHGTFTGDAAHGFTFTPAANFSGQDVDLQFSVSDGTVSREAFATLDITPVADAPVRGGLSITTDFNSVDVGAGGWKLSDPTPLGWQSSEASGVEIGQERLYGGSGNNQILSLTASWSSNIFRDLATQAGQKVHVGFDLSARPGFAMTPVEVVWEGKVVDTISPTAGTFAMQHHAYDLVATGSSSRLEFRATGQGEARALFDNIQIGTPDHLTLGDQDILLKPYLGYQLADTDGSETLSYAIHGLPVGFTLTDGTHSATVATAGQVIETTGWNQDALALRAPHGFQGDTTIQVSARAEEGSNHQSASAADFTLHLSGVPVSHVAVIGGDTAVTVTEDQQVNSQGNLEHFGQLSIVDPDAGQALFVPQNAVGATYGHYTIDQTGYWLYEADNKLAAIQQLKTGEHLTDSFTVHSADGTAQTITVTIQGQDDAAKFSAVQSYSDDIYIPIGVSLMDAGPKEFLYISEVLLANQLPRNYVTAEVAITTSGGIGLRSPDGSISVTYHSTGGVATVPLMELQAWHNKGAGYEVVLVDHPGGEVQIYAHDQGNPNLLSGFNAYVTGISNPAQASLGFNPTMHDVLAASVGVAVQGSALMPPAIAPLEFDSAHVLEDNGQLISGFIEVKDADAGQSAMKPQTDTATHYGRFSIDVNGDWIYQLDNSRPEVQQLADGQTLVDTITVLSEDGTAHEVSITIHDQNDGAVIAGADSGSVVEDNHVTAAGAIVAKGELTVTDAITGNNDQPLPSNTATGDIGNLSELSLSSSHGTSGTTPSTATDAHFATQSSPVDHYMQMLGLSPTAVNLSPSVPVELLPTLSSSDHFNDIDAPMHAIPEVNHFENPLLDNDKEQHKDRHFDLFDVTELHTNTNDDDLLHSALNDMHNQM